MPYAQVCRYITPATVIRYVNETDCAVISLTSCVCVCVCVCLCVCVCVCPKYTCILDFIVSERSKLPSLHYNAHSCFQWSNFIVMESVLPKARWTKALVVDPLSICNRSFYLSALLLLLFYLSALLLLLFYSRQPARPSFPTRRY